MGWFLVSRFLDLVRKCFLHIISRNHFEKGCWKTKTLPKENIEARTICSDIVMSFLASFCLLLNVYFNDKQINRGILWGFQGKSLMNFPSLWLVHKKKRPEKFPFIATNNWILLAARWSVKYFLLQIFQYSGKKCGREEEAEEEEEGERRL